MLPVVFRSPVCHQNIIHILHLIYAHAWVRNGTNDLSYIKCGAIVTTDTYGCGFNCVAVLVPRNIYYIENALDLTLVMVVCMYHEHKRAKSHDLE